MLSTSPVTETDFQTMSDPELLNYCGADAHKWAEAFCRIKEMQGWGATDIDEGLMIGWFANAIEHASHVRGLAQRPATDMPKWLREAFDSDSVPKKNIALRMAYDEIVRLSVSDTSTDREGGK